ncbi:nectin-2-like [Clarias gariepinus]|uniref:nectin-2-like n=1 Tax=Clarias gariepinus TaxID=13013 RepID=UPI00234C1D3E|nr:nectin-2-like [Clarias gariepinus]
MRKEKKRKGGFSGVVAVILMTFAAAALPLLLFLFIALFSIPASCLYCIFLTSPIPLWYSLQPLPEQCIMFCSFTVVSAVMDTVMKGKPNSILIIISILQGIQSVSIEHKTEVNATVGQNISLPCIMPEKHPKIIQLQWHKEGKHGHQKLVTFNPTFPTYYYANVTLQLVPETNSADKRGSSLHLQDVTEEDSGEYVCEIASFPDSSIKSFTKVQITVPKVSMTVMPTNRPIIEGDTVNITCVSNPPPAKYILSSSLVRKKIKMYCCQFLSTVDQSEAIHLLLHCVTLLYPTLPPS